MYVCVSTYYIYGGAQAGQKRVSDTPLDLYLRAAWHWCQELNLGHVEEQQGLLIPNLFSSPQTTKNNNNKILWQKSRLSRWQGH